MFQRVDTKDSLAVQNAVQEIYRELYPEGDAGYMPRIFGWARECFAGAYRDFQPVDTRYHDFEHTLQGTLCMARLMRGWRQAGAQPELTRRLFELGILAILLHDTGYLKKRTDQTGTGARYTFTHVWRSAEFAGLLLSEKSLPLADIRAVQNMIRCTGVNVDLAAIPFDREDERRLGYALGTADLLGQMAADDYVEKLPILYTEFAEASAACPKRIPDHAHFKDAEDLRRRTPAFWRNYVRKRIEADFGGVHRYLADPYPDGPNDYLERIEANIGRLERELGQAST